MIQEITSASLVSIYRFDSFMHFRDTLQRKELYFAHHSRWNDSEEGLVFRKLRERTGIDEIRKILKELSPNRTEIIPILQVTDNCMHGQSWTKCEGNSYFWQLHSRQNDSVRIEVPVEKINTLDKVEVYEIDYRDTDLRADVKAILDTDGSKIHIAPILLRKRCQFSHEQEVRLLSFDPDYLPSGRTPEQVRMLKAAVISRYKKGQFTKKQLDDILEDITPKYDGLNKWFKYIGFDHIPNFIRSVLVHPKAANCFIKEVEGLCLTNGVNFIGKSELFA
ncbi:hypothetical protein ACFLUH_03895 [Chloroflexota bacterium]